MSRIFIKPKDELKIPSPDHGGRPLPAEGAEVELSPYWQRRLDDKEVEQATPAKPAKSKGDDQ